jgi:hypothetical protein
VVLVRALLALGLCALGFVIVIAGIADSFNWLMILGGAFVFFAGFEIGPVRGP